PRRSAPLFPYTTLFRSRAVLVGGGGGEGQQGLLIHRLVADGGQHRGMVGLVDGDGDLFLVTRRRGEAVGDPHDEAVGARALGLGSEERTAALQSLADLA